MPRQPAIRRAACFTNSGGPVSIGTLTRSKPSGLSNRANFSSGNVGGHEPERELPRGGGRELARTLYALIRGEQGDAHSPPRRKTFRSVERIFEER